jgi:uncharacterized protein (DUF2141 family)
MFRNLPTLLIIAFTFLLIFLLPKKIFSQTPLCTRIAVTAEPGEIVQVPIVLGNPRDSLQSFWGLSFKFIFDVEKLEVPDPAPNRILDFRNSIIGANGEDFDADVITTRINNGEIEINIAALGDLFQKKQGIIAFLPLRVKPTIATGGAASVSIDQSFFVDNVFEFKPLGICPPSIINICKKGTFTLSSGGVTSFCEGGNLKLIIQGSIGNSTFRWLRNNAIISNETSGELNVTEAGAYRAIISTGNCQDTTTAIDISVNVLPTATETITDDNGSGNGSITLTPVLGAPPFLFSLDGNSFQASNEFRNLRAGRYTVTVQDNNNCSSSITLTVNLSGACPVAVVSPSGKVSFCAGGGVELSAPPSNEFSYQWLRNGQPISGATNSIYLARQVGNYSVRLSKAGCPDSTSPPVTLEEISNPSISASKIDATPTNGGGSITINSTGGTPPYEYSIDGGETYTSSTNNSFTFNNLSPGIYTVSVKDANNCSSPQVLIQEIRLITPSDCPDPAISPSGPIITRCAGVNVVLRAPKVNGYQYAWQRNQINIPLANLDSLVVNTTGNYRVRISFAGCPDTLSEAVTINFTPSPNVSTTVVGDSGNATGRITINATGGAPPYRYSVNNGAFSSQNVYSNLIFGTYNYAVRDNNGCEARATVFVPRAGDGCPNVSVEKDSVNVTVPGGSDGSVWTRFNNLPAGTYTVTLEGPNGCKATTLVTVNEDGVDKCDTPVNIKLDSLRNNTAYISWSLIPGAFEYRFYYRAVGSPNFILITRTTNNISLPNLRANTSYEVEIRANCSNGLFSELSSRFTFSNGTVTPICGAPTNLSFSNISNTSVLVNWNPVVGATSYLVEYRQNGVTTFVSLNANANAIEITGLQPNTTYQVRVRTNCGVQQSNFSSLTNFTTLNIPSCSAPVITKITTTETSATLQWDIVSGATGYQIRYRRVSPSTSSFQNIDVNFGTVRSQVINGLASNSIYEIQISAICGSLVSNITSRTFQTKGAQTMGASAEHNAVIVVYPNPSNGIFYIQAISAINETCQVTVIDGLGKIAHNSEYELLEGVNQIQMDLTHLASGTYLFDIRSRSGSVNQRIRNSIWK